MKKYVIVPNKPEDILSIQLPKSKVSCGLLDTMDICTLKLVETILGENAIPYVSYEGACSIALDFPYYFRMEESNTVIVYKLESYLTIEKL